MRNRFHRILSRLLELFRGRPPAHPADPFAWKPVPKKPRPGRSGGALAVAEPEDE